MVRKSARQVICKEVKVGDDIRRSRVSRSCEEKEARRRSRDPVMEDMKGFGKGLLIFILLGTMCQCVAEVVK